MSHLQSSGRIDEHKVESSGLWANILFHSNIIINMMILMMDIMLVMIMDRAHVD